MRSTVYVKFSKRKSFVDFIDDPSHTKIFLRKFEPTNDGLEKFLMAPAFKWLPNEKGQLSKVVLSSYISAVNNKVSTVTKNLGKRELWYTTGKLSICSSWEKESMKAVN